MKIFAEGRIRLNDLITARLPISQWRQAFDLCERKQALKVLLHPET
jgi:L-iditol 2-dehydrogenase